ncbi:hypothetical protein O6H91_12G000700 [Diphasiastrum complanatum]|uniref:Uncharacterized protein n=2 Tax=Diphasiastrum complanatum TaxID=34168 RepID=A0ACC2BYQ0_DIPCM|nr:hypothetical protein O6H91_12G000200 [Diphasiastrum complanatum]KAJ7534729.1 hypothetical protein O6H91_12G000700 [Diphasiastrum complanatum]
MCYYRCRDTSSVEVELIISSFYVVESRRIESARALWKVSS